MRAFIRGEILCSSPSRSQTKLPLWTYLNYFDSTSIKPVYFLQAAMGFPAGAIRRVR